MTPQAFIAKWGSPGGVPGPAYGLNEEQGAQSHFLDLCDLLGVPKPGSVEGYRFEEKSHVVGGKTGYADVFMRGVFAWENKAPGRNLDAALRQLLTYSLALSNPPILVVSDRLTIRIHTQFTGYPSQTITVQLEELDQPETLALLRRVWTAPDSFRPTSTSRDITEAAARSFATLAEQLRARGHHPDAVAHFLTQCLFCFFAEDVGLLPGRMFERLVGNRQINSDRLTNGLTSLFTAMRDGGLYGADDIPWFNGGLFKSIDVPKLEVADITELRNAADLNWSAIDVSIFGTLFERGLDPAKRSQLGAHYTDTATIHRLIEPVIERPLLQIWEQEKTVLSGLLAKSSRKGDKNHRAGRDRFIGWLERLKHYRLLDPACGSGNFLFMGLKTLKDIEHRSHLDAAALGLDREADLVTGPHNVLGIELNEYAAELARVTVWIGELQWRLAHGYPFKTNPVLEPLDHIECRDALLTFPADADKWGSDPDLSAAPQLSGELSTSPDGSGARVAQTPGAHTLRFLKSPPTSAPPTPRSETIGEETGVGSGFRATSLPTENDAQRNPAPTPISGVTEATWPKADVVIGNPPFLGDRKMIRELGEEYTFLLRRVYDGRVPGGADLVCYWFEKARAAIERNGLVAAGLVATNSIRGGKNRVVLDAIAKSTRIYEAWSDEGWVNEGAAVRVSLVVFGQADQPAKLDGVEIDAITSDLHGAQSVSAVQRLHSNTSVSFIGTQKNGPFDISGELARNWLRIPNPHGESNANVLRPWANGINVTQRWSDTWIIDFDKRAEEDASLFERPFQQVLRYVRPTRLDLRRDWHRLHWWCHGDPRPAMKAEMKGVDRQIITPRVSKHRVFAWFDSSVLPDSAVVSITRADDTTFGILHSRFHEIWSLRMGTSLEDRPRYTPTTCFETFPFPAGLTPADTAHQRTETLEGGAVIPANWGQSPISPDVLLTGTMKVAAKLESDPKFPAAAGSMATPTPPTPAGPMAGFKTSAVAGPTLAAKPRPAAASMEVNAATTRTEAGMGRRSGAISKSEAYEPPASAPSPPAVGSPTDPSRTAIDSPTDASLPVTNSSADPSTLLTETSTGPTHPAPTAAPAARQAAAAIAIAAHQLNALREAWLNPPEWTQRVPEVIPLGLDTSPYPDRIEAKPGLSEADLQALKKRTLTNLYNQRPAWLAMAHERLDAAVAAAYGWIDYTPAMPDDEILRRLLALNLERAGA